MLSIRIDKRASEQLAVASAYIEVLPNRIEAARSAALMKSKSELKNRLSTLGRPAKYIVINVEGFGPVGATLKAAPQKSYRTGKHGYDRGMAASVFLTGRRGGRIVMAKSTGWMKLRPESVGQGYPPYLKKVRLSALPSNRDKVKRLMKDITLKNLRAAFQRQGFGPRGGISRIATDAPVQIVD